MAEGSSESPLPSLSRAQLRGLGWRGERRRGSFGPRAVGEAPLNSALLPWHRRCCRRAGGWGRKEATSLRGSARFSLVLPACLLLGCSPSTHTGSPTTLQPWETLPRPAHEHRLAAGQVPARRAQLVLRTGAGTTVALRGFRREQGDVGTRSSIAPTAQPQGG